MSNTSKHAERQRKLNYFIELIELRSAIRQSRLDSEWVEDKDHPSRRLLYVLDSNVAHMFFQPTKEVVATRALPSLLTTDVDSFIAIITAQFIFEGALPGRGKIKTFMDAGHIDEFTETLQRIRVELRDGSKALSKQGVAALKRDLAQFKREVDRYKPDEMRLAKTLEKWFRKIFEKYGIEAQGSYRLLHDLIYKRDQMYPLPLGPYFRGLDITKPDPEAVRTWSEALYTEASDGSKKSRNLATDAVCLARIEMINNFLRKNGTSARYVLVTTDMKVLRAARRRQSLDSDGPPGPIVRSVRQYIPLGNTFDMDNRVANMRGTEAIEQAIDSHFALDGLLPGDRDQRLDTLHHMATSLAKHYRAKDVEPNFERQLVALQRHYFDLPDPAPTMERIRLVWSELTDNSVNLNKDLIFRHYRAWMEGVMDVVQSVGEEKQRRIGSHYEQRQVDAAGRLACAHIYVTLNSEINSKSDFAEKWSKLGLGICLDSVNSKSAPPTIAKRIVRAIAEGRSQDLSAELRKLTENPKEPQQVILASAAIALQCGLWNVAMELGELVISKEIGGTADTETLVRCRANLVFALAKRATIMSASDTTHFRANDEGKKLRESLYETAEDLKAIDYYLEASIAHAEIAWSYLYSSFHSKNEPITEATCDEIVLEIGKCFDCSESRKGLKIKDFTGKFVHTTVQARAGAALIILILQVRKRGGRVPGSARNWIDKARKALERVSRGGDRDVRNNMWALLLEIAKKAKKDLEIADFFEGLSGLDDYLAMDDDVLSGFPLEREFIREMSNVSRFEMR